MRVLLSVSILVLVGCGKGGSSSTPAGVLPVQPTGTMQTQVLTASRPVPGSDSPGTVTVSQSTVVTIPQASDLVLTANSTEFYHVYLTIGPTITCDFTHAAMAAGFTGPSCNTMATTVTIAAGQMITADIQSNSQTQTSSASVPVKLSF